MDRIHDFLPSSPTISSLSSSDLDTESTGSFFHDRSTTLGTLMGVTFPTISVRVSSRRETDAVTVPVAGSGRNRKKSPAAAERRRRRWWSLCREDEDRKPSSLREYLEVERRFGHGSRDGLFCESAVAIGSSAAGEGNGALFADGRVLPPAPAPADSPAEVACRFPVMISGICSGGA